MAIEYEHTDNIFCSVVPKVNPCINFIFVKRETLQQHIANNIPASLCIVPEDAPSDDEKITGTKC